MLSSGKQFEKDFASSIPSNVFYYRLKDSAQSYNKSAKFSWDNPFDYMLLYRSNLYCLELKTTKNKSISFEDINSDKKQNKMIHKHQIESLIKYSKYDGVISGFLFNFRHFENDKDKYFETLYYQSIEDFLNMVQKINKKSFDEVDLVLNKGIKIQGRKKIKHYTWYIEEFLKSINENVNYMEV